DFISTYKCELVRISKLRTGMQRRTTLFPYATLFRSIPPITNAWVPLIRYVSAHLQYLSGDDRELFGQELRRLRGLLGALVNENGLAQGEEEALSALNAHAARKALRQWALTSDRMMTRKELSAAFPNPGARGWT